MGVPVLPLLNDGVLQEVAREGREVGDTGIIPSAIVPFGTLGISSNNEVAFAIGGRFRSTGFLLLNENADLIDELTVPFFLLRMMVTFMNSIIKEPPSSLSMKVTTAISSGRAANLLNCFETTNQFPMEMACSVS